MPPALKQTRHRLQFSVTSLFILTTLVAIWLAWELSFIRERQVWVRENERLLTSDPTAVAPPVAHIPWWRTLLGDQAVPSILAIEWSDEDTAHVGRLFPEAVIWSPKETVFVYQIVPATTSDETPDADGETKVVATEVYGPPPPPPYVPNRSAPAPK
jgi:hypothetical protein